MSYSSFMLCINDSKVPGLLLLLLILGSILISSCNNPYAGIGEKLDSSDWINIESAGGVPFLRSFDGGRGMECLIMEGEVLKGADFGSLTIIRTESADLPIDSLPRLDIKVLQGSYLISGGNIRFDLSKVYELSFSDTGGGIVTESSQREHDIDESLAYISFNTDDAASTKSIEFTDGASGVRYEYQRMDLTIDNIMESSLSMGDRAANIHKLYQISAIFAPQSRVPGFGGADMLKYTTETKFNSLMNSEAGDHFMSLRLRQTLTATTTFTFNQASDLKPLRVNGEYVSEASMSGSGPLSGIVEFSLQGSSNTWNCSLDYNDIYVTHTVASSGSYLLSIDGGQALAIPYDNVNPGVLDFSTIPLLPDTP